MLPTCFCGNQGENLSCVAGRKALGMVTLPVPPWGSVWLGAQPEIEGHDWEDIGLCSVTVVGLIVPCVCETAYTHAYTCAHLRTSFRVISNPEGLLSWLLPPG